MGRGRPGGRRLRALTRAGEEPAAGSSPPRVLLAVTARAAAGPRRRSLRSKASVAALTVTPSLDLVTETRSPATRSETFASAWLRSTSASEPTSTVTSL